MSEQNRNRKKRKYNNPNDPRRKTAKDYHALAQNRGMEWLGSVIINTSTKTIWRCSCGNVWEAAYSKVNSGMNCPECGLKKSAKSRRRKPENYFYIARQRGFEWVGPYSGLVDEKTGWICPDNHFWMARYSSVARGTGCPVCAGNITKTDVDYILLARERGFEWVGASVKNARVKTTWKCHNGHTWDAPYASIRAGHGCPKCLLVPIEKQMKRLRLWSRKDRKRNPEKYRRWRRLYRKNNPTKVWEDNHRRLSRLRSLPYQFDETDHHRMMEYWGGCVITGETDDLHIDHWIPLDSPDCPGTVPTNMIPLVGRLNMSKQNKKPEIWLTQEFGEDKANEILEQVLIYFKWIET